MGTGTYYKLFSSFGKGSRKQQLSIMKPLFHKVPTQIQSSFSVRHDVQANFGSLWHYHPELELHHVIRGKGVRLIGDNIGNFSAGEVLLLGSNLPHMWQCNEEYYQRHAQRKVEAVVKIGRAHV